MLLLKDVFIAYKMKKEILPVIQNFSFQIDEGEALVILGPSGCGKSTLVNALAGTKSVQSGTIEYIRDDDHQPLSPKTHKIGIIPQNCGLLPWRTVQENSLLPLKIRGERIGKNRKEEMKGIYEALDIRGLLNRYPKELSGGQLQRAAIARAFILKPDLLLMDEPFSSLDAITREEARILFLKLWERNRPTTIFVTHSIEEALYLGNRIIVMGAQGGNIIYQMQNPYFGKAYPDNVDYLNVKQKLREKLKPVDEGESASE